MQSGKKKRLYTGEDYLKNLIRTPEYLYVQDGLDGKEEKIRTEDFVKRPNVNITWCETSVVLNEDLRKIRVPNPEESEIDAGDFVNYCHKFNNAREKMVLVYLNDKMGYVVKVRANKKISEGELVASYTGWLKPKENAEAKDGYAMGVSMDGKRTNIMTTAKSYGNIARFLAHAPEPSSKHREDASCITLEDYDFKNKAIKDAVLTANVSVSSISFQGYPIICLRATRDIENEMLVYDYSRHYWGDIGFPPILFNKNTMPIDPVFYSMKLIAIRVSIYDAKDNKFESCNIGPRRLEEYQQSFKSRANGLIGKIRSDDDSDKEYLYLSEKDFFAKYNETPHATLLFFAKPTKQFFIDNINDEAELSSKIESSNQNVVEIKNSN